MKVALRPAGEEAQAIVAGWGFAIAPESEADAIIGLNADAGRVDDFVLWPVTREEFAARFERACLRRAAIRRWCHDMRSPLNAIQGYAEMIGETVEGDAARFAANVGKAAEQLTSIVERLRDEGV